MSQTHQDQPSGLDSAAGQEPPLKKAKTTQKDTMNSIDSTRDETIVSHEHEVFENYSRILNVILAIGHKDEVVHILESISRLFERCRNLMPISDLDKIYVLRVASAGFKHSRIIFRVRNFVASRLLRKVFWNPPQDELWSALNALEFIGELAGIYEEIFEKCGSATEGSISQRLQYLARSIARTFYGLQTYDYEPDPDYDSDFDDSDDD